MMAIDSGGRKVCLCRSGSSPRCAGSRSSALITRRGWRPRFHDVRAWQVVQNQAVDQVRLRAAEPCEAGEITALAHRSKGYWGYDQESLDRVRELLTVRSDQIRDERVIVAERDGVLLGFYQLGGEPPDAELMDLFIEPDAIGTGLGRRLWEHAVKSARERGSTICGWNPIPMPSRSMCGWVPPVSANGKSHRNVYCH